MSDGSEHDASTLDGLARALEEATGEVKSLQGHLAQQSKMALLGTLVAGVAHDINSPLGSIKANGELATKLAERIRKRMPDDDKKLTRSLDSLDSTLSTLGLAAKRIHAIVGTLRTFARQETVELVQTDLHEGLDSSLLLVSHMFENRVTATKAYGPLPDVRCRAGEINQVFMNLLTNAVQAIEGTGTVTVSTQVVEEMVEVAIEDSGVGISEEHQAKLFKPGFTTKDAGSGTGLGLAITNRIVREHGGAISVASEPGKGACFIVRLPIAGPPQDAVVSSTDD